MPGRTTLTFAQAARLRRALDGRPVHPATLARWALRGVLLPGGQRLHLAATRCSGQWVTTLESIDQFFAARPPAGGGHRIGG